MGLYVPPSPIAPLTAPAALPSPGVYDASDLCTYCLVADGRLCGRDDCRRAVLPQLAKNGGWINLMGAAHTEQTKRQAPAPAERVAIEKVKRRNARKISRSQRRGYFGLAKSICGIK